VSKLLVAAGEAAAGADQVPPSILALIETADEVMVVAPALPDRLEWVASATDDANRRADERLRAVLGHLGDGS
jgi:hypothetical protein